MTETTETQKEATTDKTESLAVNVERLVSQGKWTNLTPTRAGYYWYIGPVLARDFRRHKKGAKIRDCAWGPIIAGVGIAITEIPSNDQHEPHERMWKEGRIVVEFYGSTVRRTLAEMPEGVLWSGPIIPPISDFAWDLQTQDEKDKKPYSAEINASEISAWW